MQQPTIAEQRAAVQIQSRFRAEVEYIERYVRLLRAKSTIHDRQIADINAVLSRVQIPPLPMREYERIGKPYSPEEIQTLFKAFRAVDPEIYQTILGHEQRLDDVPSFGLGSPAVPYLDRLNEWVGYFMERLSDDPENYDTEAAIRNATREAEEADQELDEEDRIPPDALRSLMTLAVEHAEHAKVRERIDEMVYVRHQFDEIEVLARMATPNAEIDVLRQGFILLMTAFDAAVTDLARVKFRERFFEFVRACGRSEKVTLEEIGEAGSFEVFRDRVIDEQVRRRYVKDLIGLLHSLGVASDVSQDDHVRLIELVLRRNLHVHNRGVVDDRYLEVDPSSGNPKYNLYNLKKGDAAVIDDAYFNDALERSARFVDAIAAW